MSRHNSRASHSFKVLAKRPFSLHVHIFNDRELLIHVVIGELWLDSFIKLEMVPLGSHPLTLVLSL